MARKQSMSSKAWSGGFDGKPHTINEARAKLMKLPPLSWARRIVLHNTGVPNMKRTAEIGASKYVKNVASYYKNAQYDKRGRRIKGPWSAGPHYFVAFAEPEPLIFEGTPVTVPGVHTPSWNGFAIGIEMCADFDKDDAASGDGLAVKDTACKLIAALLNKLAQPADGDTVKLHKEDAATDHDCPGRTVDKNDVISRVRAYLADYSPAGEHNPRIAAEPTKAPTSKAKAIELGIVSEDGLNLRARSGLAGDEIAVLSQETRLEIDSEAQNAVTRWLHVHVPSEHKSGWVSSRFVRVDGALVVQPKDNATKACEIIIREGWKPVAAFGLVGNFQQESYADLKTDAVGDRGTAFGIAQWRGKRFEGLEKFAERRGTRWTDLETQVLYALYELGNGEKTAGNALRAANTVEQAVKAAIGFERPRGWSKAHPERGEAYARRLAYAQALEKKWNEAHA